MFYGCVPCELLTPQHVGGAGGAAASKGLVMIQQIRPETHVSVYTRKINAWRINVLWGRHIFSCYMYVLFGEGTVNGENPSI